MARRLSHTTMLRQHKKATTTTRGTPRQRMLNDEWFQLRYSVLKAALYERVESAVITAVRRKSAANRVAIMREMELIVGDERREFVKMLHQFERAVFRAESLEKSMDIFLNMVTTQAMSSKDAKGKEMVSNEEIEKMIGE